MPYLSPRGVTLWGVALSFVVSISALGAPLQPRSPDATPAAKTQSAPLVPTPQTPLDVAPVTSEEPKADVTVTAATRATQAIESTATTSSVLTARYLENGRFPDVATALEFTPGLAVVTSGATGGQTSIFIHGLDSRHTLTTIDGRRQSTGFSGSNDNLANLTLDNVSQIEIVRSPVTSVQGGGAMGGVINLVTLSGRGLERPISSVSAEAGSFQAYRETIQSRGAAGGFDYAVAVTRQDLVNPALSPGGAFASGFADQEGQFRNSTYRGNFGYQVSPEVYLDVHTAYGNAYTSTPGLYFSPDPTANLTLETWTISPEVVAQVTDFYSTKLYSTHDQQRQSFQDPYLYDQLLSFGLTGQSTRTRSQINTDSVDWQNDFQIAKSWSLTAGLQGDHRRFYVFDQALNDRTANGNSDNLGGYLSSQWQPVEGLNILNSGRYDAYSQFVGAFSWRQGLAYTIPAVGTNLHASVGRAYTPPSLQNLYISAPAAFFGTYANPNLGSETVLGWEVGVSQPFWQGRVTPSATFFHNEEHHSIQSVAFPAGGFGATIQENVGDVRTQGAELGLAVQPSERLSLQFNGTYTEAIDETSDQRLLRRPRYLLDATGTWNPIDPLTLTVGGTWNINRIDIAEDGSRVRAPDYFTLRASGTYRVNSYLSLWIRGENLTDRNYQPALGFYANAIAGYGGIKISF